MSCLKKVDKRFGDFQAAFKFCGRAAITSFIIISYHISNKLGYEVTQTTRQSQNVHTRTYHCYLSLSKSANSMSLSSLALQTVLVPAFRSVTVTVLDLGLPVLSSELPMSVDVLLGLLVEQFQSLNEVPDDWRVNIDNERGVIRSLSLPRLTSVASRTRKVHTAYDSQQPQVVGLRRHASKRQVRQSKLERSSQAIQMWLTCRQGRSSFLGSSR